MSHTLTSVRIVTAAAITASMAVAGATTAGAAAPSAATRCGTGCSVVSRADVDGDGRADTTTVTRQKSGYTLRTTTAAGRSASTQVKAKWQTEATPFVGAARMDGVKGAELVIRTGSGAHTQYSNVYSWRRGALVAQKDPSGSTSWVTDGAMSSSIGYTVRTVKGVKQMTSISLGRDSWEKNATFSGTRIVARWQNGRWTPSTVRAITTPATDSVWNGAGWNVAGLPRW